MVRSLTRLSILAFGLAWAACSDSPTAPPTSDALPVEFEGELLAAPTATDAVSLQAALDAAADNGGTVLVSGRITLDEPLTYTGDTRLSIIGLGNATIAGPSVAIAAPSNSGARVGEETDGDALQILGDAGLRLIGLNFEGQSGHGIYYEFPGDATGETRIYLDRVNFVGQGLSGMWVEEQTGGSETSPIAIDSDASIDLILRNVSVAGTGFADDPAASGIGSCVELSEFDGCSWADFDGFRINEGGLGDITFNFTNVSVFGNAGDGVEFDETGEGSVTGRVVRSSFDGNGAQPQFPADLEDGFDIDESGPGEIDLRMFGVNVNGNVDEGVDLDGLNDGDITFSAYNLTATNNADENIKVSALGEVELRDGNGDVIFDDEGEAEVEVICGTGDLTFVLNNVVADVSVAGRGARFEECGSGNVRGFVSGSSFSGMLGDDGLRVDEEDGGSVILRMSDVVATGNDGQGLQVTENGDGDIFARIDASTFSQNDNTQVELEESDAGAHDVVVTGTIIVGSDGEDSLDVIEEDAGASVIVINGGTISPDPVAGEDPVDFQINP